MRSRPIGHVPLPPYIKRDDRPADRERYQTVFARERGSVAAPTAGLHFTAALNAALAARGIDIVEITLHVGYGTFQPVRVDRVEDHRIEPEPYHDFRVGGAGDQSRQRDDRRIIAVGTTTTRTLEAARRGDGPSSPRDRAPRTSSSSRVSLSASSQGLLTNFHLPHSSLLMLVSAFGGIEPVRAAYARGDRARVPFLQLRRRDVGHVTPW